MDVTAASFPSKRGFAIFLFYSRPNADKSGLSLTFNMV